MEPKLITQKISLEVLKEWFGDPLPEMLKVAVDIGKEIISIGGELHVDCMDQLLEAGSDPKSIWGANVYFQDKKIDFFSFINIRPAAHNRSMEVQDQAIRANIENVVRKLLPL